MVLPEYYGMGLGTMITQKPDEAVDEAGGIIYGRARPGAAALIYREGYEVLKEVSYDLTDFGAEGRKTALYS